MVIVLMLMGMSFVIAVLVIRAFFQLFLKEYMFDMKYWWYRSLNDTTHARHHRLLSSTHPYYKDLSEANKRRFIARMRVFMGTKTFIARNMPEVTEIMKVLISAASIQSTFGLQKYTMYMYVFIEVHPDSYELMNYNSRLEGHVDHERIVLAWSKFLIGYSDYTDGRNLGLHEMAHALSHNMTKKNFDYEYYERLEYWENIAAKIMPDVKRQEDHFLRKYAHHNIDEMLAVTVESFFERPEEFSETLPELYEATKLLLNQNPINRHDPVLHWDFTQTIQ